MSGLRTIAASLPFAAVLTIALGAPLAFAFAGLAPRPGEPMVVLAAPWADAARLALGAGGGLIAPGRLPAAALVWSENPSFADRLYDEGAWLVLDTDLSGILCQRSEERA
ncbi:MAG: hypothetical protein AAF416_21010 [Pseudomonadota bacterium]